MFWAGGIPTARGPVPDWRMWYSASLTTTYSLWRFYLPQTLARRVVAFSHDDAFRASSAGLFVDGAGLAASVEGFGEVSLAKTCVEAHVVALFLHVAAVILVETLWKQQKFIVQNQLDTCYGKGIYCGAKAKLYLGIIAAIEPQTFDFYNIRETSAKDGLITKRSPKHL